MSFRGGGGGGGRGGGGGGGRGGGRGGRRYGGRGLGPSGVCQCPKCGRTVSHSPGVPCNQAICPQCGMPMMRQANSQSSPSFIPPNLQQPTVQRNNLPVVDAEQCTGCGECMAQCPNGAITIQNNVAVIDYMKCKNCRLCQESCPVDAIH